MYPDCQRNQLSLTLHANNKIQIGLVITLGIKTFVGLYRVIKKE